MNRPEHPSSNTIIRRFRGRKFAFYDAAIRHGGLTALEIRLMWRLIDRLNHRTGDCWPSLKKVAAELGCNLRALKRAEKRLEEKGWILVRRGGGRGRSNHYMPNWQKFFEEPPSNTQAQFETVSNEVENSGPRVTETVAGQPPESINESCYESSCIGDKMAVSGRSNISITPIVSHLGAVVTNETRHASPKNDHDSGGIWEEWIRWLHDEGRYNEEWGYCSHELAVEDVEILRQACGDALAVRCLEIARNRCLRGSALQQRVRSAITYHGRRRAAKSE